MAKNISVVFTDDLDGSPKAETVMFVLEGTTYEIDLGEANRTKFNAVFAPYVEAGRRIGRSRSRLSTSRASAPSVDRAVIRAWAKERGLNVSARGRISAEVLRRYEAAN